MDEAEGGPKEGDKAFDLYDQAERLADFFAGAVEELGE